MSAADVRQVIADAASTVAGISCQPYFVGSTEPGAAMVRYDRTEYPDPFGGVAHWNVVILLPQDQAAAEQYTDTHIPAVRAAIAPHLVITQVQPQRLDITGVGVLPCVFINGHREEE